MNKFEISELRYSKIIETVSELGKYDNIFIQELTVKQGVS